MAHYLGRTLGKEKQQQVTFKRACARSCSTKNTHVSDKSLDVSMQLRTEPHFTAGRAPSQVAPNLNKGEIMKKQNKRSKPASKSTTKKQQKPAAKTQAVKATKKASPAKCAPKAKTATKTTGKSSSASKNSVRKAVSANSNKTKPVSTSKKTSTKTTAAKKAPNTSQNLVTVEIRLHNDANGGHPHIMVDTVQDKNVSVGISHGNKKGKNHPNIKLEHNPLGGKEQSYMQRQGTVDRKKNYGKEKKIGQMTATDNAKAKRIGERAKQKHLAKQKPKK